MYPRPINIVLKLHLYACTVYWITACDIYRFSEIGEYFMWVEMKKAEFGNKH